MLILVVVLVLAAAIAVPFLVPMSSYIPHVTALLSEKLRVPVSIEDLTLKVLPTPRAVASGVVVGKRQDVRIQELEIVPDVFSLFAERWTIRRVRAEKVDLKESAIPMLVAISKSDTPDPYQVSRVQLHEVRLRHSAMTLPLFNVDARLGERYRVERARLELGGGAIDAVVQPESATAALITAEGTLYGGNVDGYMRLDWARQWQASGRLHLVDVDLAPLQKILNKPVRLTGKVTTETTYSSRARSPDRLLDDIVVDGPFQVAGGEYHGVDLAKAGDLTATRSAGDATRFDEFKGQLALRGKQVKISELCVRSPALIAGGSLEIAEDQKLSGKMSVSVAKTGGFVGVPVSLSGTVADPGIKPTTAYTIGAVVGTLILPGIGTGIGASAASAIEGSAVCK